MEMSAAAQDDELTKTLAFAEEIAYRMKVALEDEDWDYHFRLSQTLLKLVEKAVELAKAQK